MGTVSRLIEKHGKYVPVLRSEEDALEAAEKVLAFLGDHPTDTTIRHIRSEPPFEILKQSGLLGICAPADHGGADISNIVLCDIIRHITAADPVFGDYLAGHFTALDIIRNHASPDQQALNFSRAIAGDLFATLLPEEGSGGSHSPVIFPQGVGPGWRLAGEAQSALDLILADWIVVAANVEDNTEEAYAVLPCIVQGLRLQADRAMFENLALATETMMTADGHVNESVRLLLDAAIALGRANRILSRRHSPWAVNGVFGGNKIELSRYGLASLRFECACATLEQAGKLVDIAQVNGDAPSIANAAFHASIAREAAREALEVAEQMIDATRSASILTAGYAPIGEMALARGSV
jgi:alkylation response protein AidB-like acyl-CoA dehydrogenase